MVVKVYEQERRAEEGMYKEFIYAWSIRGLLPALRCSFLSGAFLLAILVSIPNTKINRKDNPGD